MSTSDDFGRAYHTENSVDESREKFSSRITPRMFAVTHCRNGHAWCPKWSHRDGVLG
jgi:hypothetical protein